MLGLLDSKRATWDGSNLQYLIPPFFCEPCKKVAVWKDAHVIGGGSIRKQEGMMQVLLGAHTIVNREATAWFLGRKE